MRKMLTLIIISGAVFSASLIHAGEAEDALNNFRAAWKGITTYQVTMVTHQVKGSKSEDNTVKFSYKAPGWIKSEMLEGKHKGSVAIYDPATGKITAKQSGLPKVTMSADNKLAQGLRGDKIYEGSFGHMLETADWYLAHGSMEYLGEAQVDGKKCVVIQFKTSSPSSNDGIAREKWWLDSSTGFPRKLNAFDASGSRVAWTIYRYLKINPGFPAGFFEL